MSRRSLEPRLVECCQESDAFVGDGRGGLGGGGAEEEGEDEEQRELLAAAAAAAAAEAAAERAAMEAAVALKPPRLAASTRLLNACKYRIRVHELLKDGMGRAQALALAAEERSRDAAHEEEEADKVAAAAR